LALKTEIQKTLTPAQRRERNREEVSSLILEAARAVMREDGVAALNLNEVARRVNMKTPSLYEYFPGKMAIYDALYLKGVQIYTRSIEKVAGNKDLEFWDRVEERIWHFMNFAYEHPDLYFLVFERPVPEFTPSEKSMAESYRLLQVSDAMLQQYAPGHLNSDLPLEQVRDIFIMVMQGLTSNQMANEPHLPPGQGRFGSLIPVARAILEAAWGKPVSPTKTRKKTKKTGETEKQAKIRKHKKA
jgi:AcrR family transcriptional regulator